MTTSTSTFVPAPAESQADFKTRFMARLTPPVITVIGIMLLAALLNFINIDSIGQANTYYTAAIEAMLQSPSNFFFAAAEPGGSVTIDKPPVGLWLQAISAFFLGVSGFSVVLPQILAGISSVPLLYALVKRYFGTGAGLIAALVMAIMPVSVAVQRNNTMDATLIFTLLLAAWAFIQATEHGKLKWLLLGAVLVGIGFNIKMMQAFLPLPAFYGLYFLGSKVAWRTKIVHLVVTTMLLLAVSLSWIIVVDLVPAENRPYVGSSQTNSALELAVGYNGIQRLLGGTGRAPANRQDDGQASTTSGTPGTGTDGQTGANGQPFTPPAGMTPPTGAPGAGGGMFANEVGTAGVTRLFTQPLDNEIGWLLPFSLLSIGLLAVASRPRLPLSTAHKGVILWGGWLVTQVVFFSVAGFFHAYYLAMLTPPLAALVGIGVMRLWEGYPGRRWLSWSLLIGFAAATLAWQANIAAGYINSVTWMLVPAVTLVLGAVILVGSRLLPRLSRYAIVGLACVVITLTVVPAVWAGLSSTQTSANVNLPAAYSGIQSPDGGPGGGFPPGAPAGQDGNQANRPGRGFGGGVDTNLITYLQANTTGMRWMMAVGSSQQGAGYVLETGRGVLYMGGFNGQDPVVTAESLQAYVDAGELRYVLGSTSGQSRAGMATDTSIQTWLDANCAVVTDLNLTNGTLFDCAA